MESNGNLEELKPQLEEAFINLKDVDKGSVIEKFAQQIDMLMQPEIAKANQHPHLFYLGNNYHIADIPSTVDPLFQILMKDSFASKTNQFLPYGRLDLEFQSRGRYRTHVTTETTPVSLRKNQWQAFYIEVDGVRIPVKVDHTSNGNNYSVLAPVSVDKSLLDYFVKKFSADEQNEEEKLKSLAEINRKEYMGAQSEIQALRLLTQQPNIVLNMFNVDNVLLTGDRLMDDEELENWLEVCKKIKSVTDSSESVKLGEVGFMARSDVKAKFNLPGGLLLQGNDLDGKDLPTGTKRILFPITVQSDSGRGYQICELTEWSDGKKEYIFIMEMLILLIMIYG